MIGRILCWLGRHVHDGKYQDGKFYGLLYAKCGRCGRIIHLSPYDYQPYLATEEGRRELAELAEKQKRGAK